MTHQYHCTHVAKQLISSVLLVARQHTDYWLLGNIVARQHTVCRRVWLDAVDDVGVGSEQVDHLSRPLVPHEDPTTVTAAQHPVVPPEVGLLDLEGRRRGGEGK